MGCVRKINAEDGFWSFGPYVNDKEHGKITITNAVNGNVKEINYREGRA